MTIDNANHEACDQHAGRVCFYVILLVVLQGAMSYLAENKRGEARLYAATASNSWASFTADSLALDRPTAGASSRAASTTPSPGAETVTSPATRTSPSGPPMAASSAAPLAEERHHQALARSRNEAESTGLRSSGESLKVEIEALRLTYCQVGLLVATAFAALAGPTRSMGWAYTAMILAAASVVIGAYSYFW